ncbi:MAG: polysaccharide biosynthesis tyrosine autokinase [Steroidobacteraceae bacterium]
MSVEELLIPPAPRLVRAREPVDMHIGQVLLRAGKLTETDIRHIVSMQGVQRIRFGDAAVNLGLVDRHDVQQALSEQFNYPLQRTSDSLLSRSLVTARDPFGAAAEAFRRLRTQMSMRWFSKNKSLVVTSTRSDQGAHLIAANLAIAFAQIGIKTLLIDANFRQPRQQRLFGLEPDKGLSTLLVGRASYDEVVCPVDGFGHLTVICAGPIPPNPQELLETSAFIQAMKWFAQNYDVVIFDSAAMLEFADTQTIANRASGCLLSIRRHATRVADIEHAKSLLVPASAVLVGTVLCD